MTGFVVRKTIRAKMKVMLLRHAVAVLILFQASTGRSQNEPKPLDLAQAVNMAIENNESVLIANNDVKIAGQQIREAWADALPNLSFSGIYTRNFKSPVTFLPEIIINPQGDPNEFIPVKFSARNSYVFNLNVEQPIFQAGKISGGLNAARHFKEFSAAGYNAVKTEVVFQVKRAYYTVKLNEQLLAINRQSLEQQLANLRNTRKLFEQGQVSELDTLRAWVEYSNLQPQVIRAENQLRISKNRLKELIGLQLDEPVTLVTELTQEQRNDISYEQVEAQALKNRPELRQLEYQAEILKENIRIVRSDHFPKLFLSGSYQEVAQSNTFDFGDGLQSSLSGAVRLEVPIFQGFRTSARVQQAKIDYRNAQHEINRFRENLKIEVNSIFLRVKEAEKRIQVQEHAVTQAERALFMAQRRYNEGAGTQLEQSDALLALNITKTNHVQAIYDYRIALAELDKAIGRQ